MAALPQQNRYLWVQFVGLAAVPLLLDVCLAGLASSRTAFGFPTAFGLQFWLIAAVSIVPPLAMQCLRPFYIFSLPPLALKPSVLSTNQRRCLRLLESWQIKVLAVGSAGGSLWLLSQLYARSPRITPIMTPNAGIIATVVAFFWVCTFLQISISSARLLLVGPEAMKRVKPYEPPAIAANFFILGLRVGKILPMPSDKVITEPRKERITESASFYDQGAKPQETQGNVVITERIEDDTATVEPEPEPTKPEPTEPEPTEPERTEATVIGTEQLEPKSDAEEPQPDGKKPVTAEAELPTEVTISEASEPIETESELAGQFEVIEPNEITTAHEVTTTHESDPERL